MAVNSLEMRREKNWDFGTGEARLSTDQSSQKLYKAGLFQVRKPFFPTVSVTLELSQQAMDTQNCCCFDSRHIWSSEYVWNFQFPPLKSLLLGFLAVSISYCITTYFTIFSHSDNYFLPKVTLCMIGLFEVDSAGFFIHFFFDFSTAELLFLNHVQKIFRVFTDVIFLAQTTVCILLLFPLSTWALEPRL